MSELLTLSQASAILGVHPNTLRNWDNNGSLTAIRLGPKKMRRWKKEDIMKIAQINDLSENFELDKTEPFYLRRLHWKESIYAVKESVNFTDISLFKKFIVENLPQNSCKTRDRMASAIIHWFFPNGNIKTLSSDIWRIYRDEELLRACLKYEYLCSERSASEIYLDKFYSLKQEIYFSSDYLDRIIDEYFSEKDKISLRKHLRASFQDLGIIKIKKDQFKVCSSQSPLLSFLIVLHYIFSHVPQTISFKTLIGNPFWKYLGARTPDELRKILMKADEKNILKYVIADQLEQVTTQYSYQEFIECRCGL